MSDRTPFFNFQQPVPYAAPAPTQQFVPAYGIPPAPPAYGHVQQPLQHVVEPMMAELTCDLCEGRIDHREPAAEVFLGIAERSQQTGYLTTMPDPQYFARPDQVAETTTVHRECLIEHAIYNVCPEVADDMLAEQVMEMATELFEEWKQSYLLEGRLEDRLSDPDS